MIQAAHKQWEAYRQAVLLAKEMYRLTERFPDTERAVLTYTLRRLTILLCQNIAAATLRRDKKKRALLKTCLDTCIAIDTQLEIAFIANLTTAEAATEVIKLLGLIYNEVKRVVDAT